MRIAVFADVHGNGVALEAVLADLERDPPDRMVCLGDAIQGGPQPAGVARRLMGLGCPVVMGNADAWLLTGRETGPEPIPEERRRRMERVRAWALDGMSAAEREFVAGFVPTVRLALEAGRELLCFHGSPLSFDDILLPTTPDDAFRERLGPHGAYVLTGGHTHLQQLRRLGEGWFFNPGSVGMVFRHGPEDGPFRADPWAEYAVLASEGERIAVEFRRVPFDVAELLRAYRESGRPHAEEGEALYGRPGRPPGRGGC